MNLRKHSLLAFLLILAACSSSVPPFARQPYEPFSRADAIAVAEREWRLFGEPVHDEKNPSPHAPEEKPEREPGLWQRVGEYNWIGLNSSSPLHNVTGKHDGTGAVFPAQTDEKFAWSASFISYVMRIAGASDRFPYSESHSIYINTARQAELGGKSRWAIRTHDPKAYVPVAGDIVCQDRRGGTLTYSSLPKRYFYSHCDIVTAAGPSLLTTIGGNLNDEVAMRHVALSPEGKLVNAKGESADPKFRWLVVLEILYDQ